MAKVSIIEREKKREHLEKKYRTKREELKQLAKESYKRGEIPWEIQAQLQSLPRNASFVRLHRRCRICGRPRGVYRRFGLCRLCLRELVMNGLISGVRKSSW